MRHSTKIRLLVNRYGLEGYGLYNLMLESITENLEDRSPVPELKESCEDLAEIFNGNTAKINEMASWMINAGLFELSEITQRITCPAIFKYLDSFMTRSDKVKEMIQRYKMAEKGTNVLDRLGQNQPETETETETETEILTTPTPSSEAKRFSKPTVAQVEAYCQARSNGIDAQQFIDHYESKGWKVGKTPMKDWQAAVRTWEKYRIDHAPQHTRETDDERAARMVAEADAIERARQAERGSR
jgi:hypothetical protein